MEEAAVQVVVLMLEDASGEAAAGLGGGGFAALRGAAVGGLRLRVGKCGIEGLGLPGWKVGEGVGSD